MTDQIISDHQASEIAFPLPAAVTSVIVALWRTVLLPPLQSSRSGSARR